MPEPSICCPRCRMVSFNLNDMERRYCGNCHEFHEGLRTNEMDPDATLRELRSIADRVLRHNDHSDASVIAQDATSLAERVVAIDEWIRNGGFLPKPWHDVQVAKVLT